MTNIANISLYCQNIANCETKVKHRYKLQANKAAAIYFSTFEKTDRTIQSQLRIR